MGLALFPKMPRIYTGITGFEMSILIPLVALNQPGEEVLAWLSQRMTAEGFRLARTFDLQAARLPHHDCSCPHHGTDQCDCQMVVLLVYGKENAPATVVLHSQDGKTWLSLAEAVGNPSNRPLEAAIKRTLAPRLTDASSGTEIRHEGG